MAEIFSMLSSELEKHEIAGSFGAGVILVGGGALLSGATELAAEIFRMPARIGFPEAISGLDRLYIDPRYSTLLGEDRGKEIQGSFFHKRRKQGEERIRR